MLTKHCEIAGSRWTWEAAHALLESHGGALYLVELDRFAENCRALLSEFHRYYPRTALGYSYKTNYTPAICRKAAQIGCYAEVVSRMELDLAFRLGVPGDRIIFNGPVKSHDDLRAAIGGGAIIHLDNAEEWETIEAMAGASETKARIAIRCNFPLDQGRPSRFGFDVTTGQVHAIAAKVRGAANANLEGLHCHFSHHREAESYRLRAETLVRLCGEIFTSEPPRYVDIGGGYCGPMPEEFRAQFATPVPSYGEYAQAVGPVLERAFGRNGPELILEPGMGLIADCVRFMTHVTSVKSIRGRNFAVTPGNVYCVKPTMNALNLPLEILRRETVSANLAGDIETDIVGSTCMEVDVMYRGLREPVAIGDVLIFGNVGAYTNVLLPPFIRPAPPMLALENNELRLVRRGQTSDDVFSTYVF